jgi:hypothetical protein
LTDLEYWLGFGDNVAQDFVTGSRIMLMRRGGLAIGKDLNLFNFNLSIWKKNVERTNELI